MIVEMDINETDGIPTELKERLGSFDSAVSQLESTLQPLLSTSYTDLIDKLGPLDAAKLDLVAVYSINSLFWMYLNVCGVNPKDHPVKNELERIRSYMSRIKEAQDAMNKPKLDKAAAKRFVKHSLWQKEVARKEESSASATQTPSGSKSQNPEDKVSPGSRKRKHRD
ncbi:nuclear nucleic acid-binding protein C1D-like [Babylonia areolata]|uniref:nuclear nucleic acid-binding protein C1D-like n=1 Tax=Babylonia areolata TaxID=304850 RepID=UPI003FD1D095